MIEMTSAQLNEAAIPTMNLVGLAMQLRVRTTTAQRSFEEAEGRMTLYLTQVPDSSYVQMARELAQKAEAYIAAKEHEKMVRGHLAADILAQAEAGLEQMAAR